MPKRRVVIEPEKRPRRRKRPPGRGWFQGRPTIDFKTTHDFHAVDLEDARKLARRLREGQLTGIAERIEDAIARGKPFVPSPDERDALSGVFRTWIMAGTWGFGGE